MASVKQIKIGPTTYDLAPAKNTTINLTGDVTGSATLVGDGTAVNITTTVQDNSHNHNYAGSASAGGAANFTNKIATYQVNNKNETYGENYPIYAQWITNNRAKFICDNYTTEVDMAAKLANSSGVISVGSATQPVYFSNGVPVATSSLAPKDSPTLTGTPKAPTAAAGTNTTQIATTAFVQTALSSVDAGTDVVVSSSQPSGQSTGSLWFKIV